MSVGVEKSYRIQYIVYQKDQAETKRWKPGLFLAGGRSSAISKNKGKCSHRRSINYDKSSKKHQCVIEK